jgi:DNA-binding NarL/FixJ family response regulator
MPRAMAGRARAAVLLADDPAAAAQRALASASDAASVGAAVESALSRALAGRAFARAGDARRAVAELERAAAELHAHGAARARDEVERELRKLGRAVHRRSRPGKVDATGVDALTARELEVARLIVDRKTNPEIAQELFVSLKTVETHVRNMFFKLEVTSRVELARAVERAARDTPEA